MNPEKPEDIGMRKLAHDSAQEIARYVLKPMTKIAEVKASSMAVDLSGNRRARRAAIAKASRRA